MTVIAYRPEIDGLRTLAIVPVVLFHAGMPGLAGGFVGVDVFFVISGYLITSILSREMERGRFSLLDFYERRARRILPALLLVIAVSTPFAIWLLLPYQLVDYGQSLIATMLFVSNILFFLESNYFAPDSALKPLLHTWTLAVEEQFYLLFPLLLWLIWPLGRRWTVIILAAISMFSLVSAEILWRQSLTAAFFLTPGRVWELLVGSLLALSTRPPAQMVGRSMREGLSALGLALIAASVALLSQQVPYPSLFTIAPVAGAALIIAFAAPDTVTGRLLSLRPMVGVGLISYSAYLWHQPMFAFVKLWLGERPSIEMSALLVAATFAVAAASWRWVEQPFRNRTVFPPRRIARASGVSVGVALAIGSMLILSNGLAARYPLAERELALLNPREEGRYIRRAFRSYVGKPFDDDPVTRNVLIIGDSYAEDFINTALENGYLSAASLSTISIPANCGIVLREGGHADLIEPMMRPRCAGETSLSDAEPMLRSADIVILAASWRDWVVELLPETLARLRDVTDAEIVVISRKSFGPLQIRDYLAISASERMLWRNPIDQNVDAINRHLRESVGETLFVDIPSLVCDDGVRCPVFTPSGALLSTDGFHLTRSGARYVGTRIFAHEALAKLR